jgi:hypothetical protein
VAEEKIPTTNSEIHNFLYRLGKNIASYRKVHGLTQDQLIDRARKLDMWLPHGIFSGLESGEVYRVLDVSAQILGLEVKDFLSPPTEQYVKENSTAPPPRKEPSPRKRQPKKSRTLTPEQKASKKAEQEAAKRGKKESESYNTFYLSPVSAESITNAALSLWSYTDDRMRTEENKDGWTEDQVREAMSMLFDDLRP